MVEEWEYGWTVPASLEEYTKVEEGVYEDFCGFSEMGFKFCGLNLG